MVATPRRAMRGFTLIEMLVALAIGMVLLAAGSAAMIDYFQSQALTAAAQHLQRVALGVDDYIADNKTAIIAATGPTTPYVIEADDLTGGGYLPTGFNTTNGFGQEFEARVVQPAANVLEAVIFTTGGDTLTGLDTIKAAHLMGAPGGFIPPDATGIAKGSFGGWQVTLSDYGITPGAGHLAFALFMATATSAGIASASPGTTQRFTAAMTVGLYDGAFSPARYAQSEVHCPPGWTREAGGVIAGTSLPDDRALWDSRIHDGAVGTRGWRVWVTSSYFIPLTAYVDCTAP